MVAEASVIDLILAELQDVSATAVFGTAQIQRQIARSLVELSRYSPNITFATVTFAGTAHKLDCSTLTNLLWVDRIEYKIDKDPRRYRNFDDNYLDSVEVNISFTPSTGDTAFVYFAVPHTLSGATNSMRPDEEQALIQLAAARLAISQPMANLNTQAADLMFADLSTAILKAQNTILEAATAFATGGSIIGTDRLNAATAVAAMATIIDRATADLGSARSFTNQVNIGIPESDYVNFAGGELNVAAGKLREAQGYLQEDSPPRVWQAQGSGRLSEAGAALGQANTYMNRIRAQIQSTILTDKYEAWGRRKLVDAERELRGIARPRIWEEYSEEQ